MNPNPLSSLNHFTVPLAISVSPPKLVCCVQAATYQPVQIGTVNGS
jgi:hypothetical protein